MGPAVRGELKKPALDTRGLLCGCESNTPPRITCTAGRPCCLALTATSRNIRDSTVSARRPDENQRVKNRIRILSFKHGKRCQGTYFYDKMKRYSTEYISFINLLKIDNLVFVS